MEKKILEKLKNELKPERFVHSLNVADTAEKIALHYAVDIFSARTAGILHDCARDLPVKELLRIAADYSINIGIDEKENPLLLHAQVGRVIAREFYNIKDERILNAIACHTFGCEYMDKLDKIIYIADKIEPGRVHPGVDCLREIVFRDLDKAVLMCFDQTINYLVKKGKVIHPQSIRARNSLLRQMNKEFCRNSM